MGGVPVEIPMTESMELDLDAFASAITDKTKLIFVCNPNNPTGTIKKAVEVENFLKKVPNHVIVVFDEAYFEYVDSAEYKSALDIAPGRENVVACRTFSKVYGLAGTRVGYMIANEDFVRMMLNIREPFPVNRIGQAGAVAALDDDEFVQSSCKVNAEGRKQYAKAFDEMGLKYYESHTNFIYVDIDNSSAEVFNLMLKDGVIIRPQAIPGYKNAIRITIGTKEENERAIASFKKALS
jgi:histidinol-phosphate aminotransferase